MSDKIKIKAVRDIKTADDPYPEPTEFEARVYQTAQEIGTTRRGKVAEAMGFTGDRGRIERALWKAEPYFDESLRRKPTARNVVSMALRDGLRWSRIAYRCGLRSESEARRVFEKATGYDSSSVRKLKGRGFAETSEGLQSLGSEYLEAVPVARQAGERGDHQVSATAHAATRSEQDGEPEVVGIVRSVLKGRDDS